MTKGQLISERIYEVIVSLNMRILGEMMTSQILKLPDLQLDYLIETKVEEIMSHMRMKILFHKIFQPYCDMVKKEELFQYVVQH